MPPLPPLPIDEVLPDLITALRARGSAVLSAPPGAGKTTRVPPALVAAGLLGPDAPRVVLLQPRRVAARAAASRIAFEQGWTVGHEVGYQIRFEKRTRRDTRVEVVTEGILTRRLLSDPFLEGVGAVLLDEFHERSLHTDLALAMLREVRDTVRDDLRLVVMSATLDAGPVARFLGDAPVVRSEGRAFPVEIEYDPGAPDSHLSDRVRNAVERLAREADRQVRPHGDVLVFLPGMEEIRRSARALEPLTRERDWLVLPLHGSLSGEDQDRALRPAPRPKVVLATNVAETSLTIDGITAVVDSGLARLALHDPATGLDRLELRRISRASASQRAGRAGRTGPGRCIRLWSERDERGRPEFERPEIGRVDLGSTVLALHAWGHPDPARFPWFEPPSAAALEGAERTLRLLDALDPAGRITELGRRLLAWPAHPRLARLLEAAAAAGRLRDGATLAALLAEKDLLSPPATSRPGARTFASKLSLHADSDLLVRRDALAEAEAFRFSPSLRDRGLDPSAARRVAQARDDLARIGRHESPADRDRAPAEDAFLGRLVLLAYPDRVCLRRTVGGATARMVGGRGVRLDPSSTVREAPLFLALDARDDSRSGPSEAIVRVASAIELDWLSECFPTAIHRDREARFDPDRQRVVGLTRWRYHDLVLREEPGAALEPAEAARALAEALAPEVRSFFRADEAVASWLDRVDFLRAHLPETGLPAFDDETLREVLVAACDGCVSTAEIRRVDLVAHLQARLSHPQLRTLASEAPATLEVPSGNRIRVHYEPGRPPRLAVRLQELFGWAETPRLAGGRVPVLLELLGPNFRPVQLTSDLRSFWTTTYAQVRKDLRGRYPKHSWPEDPWTARPESRGGRRREA